MKFLRWPLRIVTVLFAAFIIYVNIALYDTPVCDPVQTSSVNIDALKQLHFLRRMLHEENAGEEMQLIYPEGYVFIYALYALAWCEVVEVLPPASVDWQEGMREIAFSLNSMDSPTGRNVFNPDLPLTYGAYYRGWTAYVRGRYLQVVNPADRDSLAMQRFQSECDAIAKAVSHTDKPYLESYRDLAWPADNVVCLAALSLHDRIAEPRFQEVKKDWIRRIKGAMDREYELIPHGFDLDNNRPLDGVRGSSQSLILSLLPDIDSLFALEQYQKYRKHFLTYRLSLPGIREYPEGEWGSGDIDSGPVVMGVGGAASVVGIKAAIRNNDTELALVLYESVGALLFSKSNKNEKCYLFGQLPVLDAFMAWSSVGICAATSQYSNNWRWKFQLISIVLVTACAFIVWKT